MTFCVLFFAGELPEATTTRFFYWGGFPRNNQPKSMPFFFWPVGLVEVSHPEFLDDFCTWWEDHFRAKQEVWTSCQFCLVRILMAWRRSRDSWVRVGPFNMFDSLFGLGASGSGAFWRRRLGTFFFGQSTQESTQEVS